MTDDSPMSLCWISTFPVFHGFTLYNELRQQPLTEGIPIVVVTGVEIVPPMAEVMVLRKPCSMEQVIDAIDQVLTGGAPAGSL